ncbi:sporulation protein [Streptomyces sp. PmtA]|uniref:sporulation protein n=1 Tax=Streptomyces sp. PmtA TaxID=3074275 RepID=UPI0030157D2F
MTTEAPQTTPDDKTQPAPPSESTIARASADLLEHLADQLGARASVRAVDGEPVTSGNITVIPVAEIAYGFGGGGGRDSTAAKNGEDGGGAAPARAGACGPDCDCTTKGTASRTVLRSPPRLSVVSQPPPVAPPHA